MTTMKSTYFEVFPDFETISLSNVILLLLHGCPRCFCAENKAFWLCIDLLSVVPPQDQMLTVQRHHLPPDLLDLDVSQS